MKVKNIDVSINDGRASSLLVSSDDSTRLVVFFPGTGYGTDKPLFYYAGKVAQQLGCDVLKLSYGDIDWRRAVECDPVTLGMAVERCIHSMEKAAAEGYSELVFVSKSFGTVVAGEVEKELHRKVSHIFLTPLVQALPYMRKKGQIAVAGAMDQIVSREELEELNRKSGIKIFLFDDANHSLEVEGDPQRSVEILYEVTGIVRDYLTNEGNHAK